MKILIDIQGCQNGSRFRGIGRSSLALTRAMLQQARPKHEIYLLLNGLFADTVEPIRRELADWIEPSRILVFQVPGPVDELREDNAWRKHAAEQLREYCISQLDPDAVFVTSMVEGSMDNTVSAVGWLSGRPLRCALLHDLIPLLDPDRYIGWPPARRWYMGKVSSLARCDLLLSVSESARQEAIKAMALDPSRVVSISSAADPKFENCTVTAAQISSCRARLGLDRPYLMHAGTIEARKNFDGLIRAFGALNPALRSRYQLVLVGKFDSAAQQQLHAAAAAAGLADDDLVLTGHISDDDLIALYADCHLFVYPSLHEGFGLPALEAMHFGVPVIGSNVTSIPEVIGRDDATFDPTSTTEMASLIARCLTDSSFRAELSAHARQQSKRFTWAASAQVALQAIEQAVVRAGLQHQPALINETMVVKQLVAGYGAPGGGTTDLALAAQCIAANELAVQRVQSEARNSDALVWRVEGPFDSSYSLALVNRESARALSAYGHTVVLHSTEGPGDFDPDPAFLAAHTDLAGMHARLSDHPPATCTVVSRNLYPPRVTGMDGEVNILGHYAWEETGFPSEWVTQFNQCLSGITCTSEHVRKVLIDNGVRVPLAVVGNGVDHWDRIEPVPGRRFGGKRFRFLHVSSCFPRKGADALLAAFGHAFTNADDVSLLIKTFANPHNTIREQLEAIRRDNAQYPDVEIIEEDLADGELKSLYVHCHVLVAPSRAEGFGLPLAEAMLSGLPVITTGWSGALDFCDAANSWLVDFSFTPTATHFGLPQSVWADPDIGSLVSALRSAHMAPASELRRRAEAGAAVLRTHYTWADASARAIRAVQRWRSDEYREQSASAPRVGWVTTWNTRCGIATYSQHFLDARTGEQVHVLAPRDTGRLSTDEAFVSRCWAQGKHGNDLAALSASVAAQRLDVLVIQFNYGFFEFAALAEFLHQQVDLGRVVMLTMHATYDPPELAAHDANWQLRTLVPALMRCHRLLVHSVADLNRLRALGITHNAALFPHPVWRQPSTQPTPAPASPAVLRTPESTSMQRALRVGTFGFCLPGKGLEQVLHAVADLNRRDVPVELLMLNAQFPVDLSQHLASELQSQIRQMALEDRVTLRTEFLPDDEVDALLAECDLIVFAYQATGESASGAVRHGMGTGQPVLVTPIPIFDELGGAVFRAEGIDPASIANAIEQAGADLKEGSPRATEIAARAQQWRVDHDVERLMVRLQNMEFALWRDLKWESHATGCIPQSYVLDGSSRQIQGHVGFPSHRDRVSDGKAGLFFYGQHLQLPAGEYEVTVRWASPTAGNAQGDFAINGGNTVILHWSADEQVKGSTEWRFRIRLEYAVADLELRIEVTEGFVGTLTSLAVKPAQVPSQPTGGDTAGAEDSATPASMLSIA